MLNLFKKGKYMPYAAVVIAYAAVLFLIYLLIDRVVFPGITSSDGIAIVPEIQGKDFGTAKSRLAEQGLGIEIVKEVYSEKYKSGTVVNQTPAANAQVKSGRAIFVTVSKGKETVVVPYITGLTMRTARVALLKSGLELGNVSYEFSEKFGKDTVMLQGKPAGARVPYGEAVGIVMSKGAENQIKIPNVTGLGLAEAKAAIEESGFVLGEIKYLSDETYLPGLVMEQLPAAGEVAATGTTINITITK